MKSVVWEKHEFQNQGESTSQTLLAFAVHQNCNAQKQLTVFMQILPRKEFLFICDFGGRTQSRKKMRLKIEIFRIFSFEFWVFMAFGFSWTITIVMQQTNQSKLSQRVDQNQNTLDCTFETRYKFIS